MDPVFRYYAFDLWDPVNPTRYFKWPPTDPDVHRELCLLEANPTSETTHSQFAAAGMRGQRSHKQGTSSKFKLAWKIVSQDALGARQQTYETYLRPWNASGIIRVRFRIDSNDLAIAATRPVSCFDWDIPHFNPEGGPANQDWDPMAEGPVDGSIEYITALPTAPANPAAVAAAGPQITVSWDASTETFTNRLGYRARGYRLLRGTATGVYTHQIIDTDGVITAVPYNSATDDEPDTLALSTESTSIVDDTVVALTQYFYVVEVVDYFNFISAPSAEVDDTTP